jgi:hypothetical protein
MVRPRFSLLGVLFRFGGNWVGAYFILFYLFGGEGYWCDEADANVDGGRGIARYRYISRLGLFSYFSFFLETPT